ncbi:MAG: aldo/keto reductase, partial [Candidatus Sumerlaeota bacterium]
QFEERKRKGAIDAFRKAKEEGLVKHVSVSTHLQHGQVEALLEESEGLFESMLIGINAVNFQMRIDGVKAAHERGIPVVTMNTLHGGLLTDHPEKFKHIMREDDKSIVESALRFNISLPEVNTALVGFRNLADVDSAVDAMDRFEPLSDEELHDMQKDAITGAEALCTQCNYCDGCPQDIPVLRLMEGYNRKILTGNAQSAQNQLKYHWGIPDVRAHIDNCTECQQCVQACTQHLPIMERFEELRADKEAMEGSKA